MKNIFEFMMTRTAQTKSKSCKQFFYLWGEYLDGVVRFRRFYFYFTKRPPVICINIKCSQFFLLGEISEGST